MNGKNNSSDLSIATLIMSYYSCYTHFFHWVIKENPDISLLKLKYILDTQKLLRTWPQNQIILEKGFLLVLCFLQKVLFFNRHTLSTCYMYGFDVRGLKNLKFHQLRGSVLQNPRICGWGENRNKFHFSINKWCISTTQANHSIHKMKCRIVFPLQLVVNSVLCMRERPLLGKHPWCTCFSI